MAAPQYQNAAEAFDFLAPPDGRVTNPASFLRFVRHAALLDAHPFPVLDRDAVLPLAFLMAIGAVRKELSCNTCGATADIVQRLRGDGLCSYVFRFHHDAARPCCSYKRERVTQGSFLDNVQVGSWMACTQAFVGWCFGLPVNLVELDLDDRRRQTVAGWYTHFRQMASRWLAGYNHLPAATRAQVDETYLDKWRRGNRFQVLSKCVKHISPHTIGASNLYQMQGAVV